jgi:PTS system ascorbate-specific IIA component
MHRLVVVAHEPLAASLRTVALHAYPECAGDVVAVDIPASDDIVRAAARVRAALPAAEALILTDVFGATPCNAALSAAEGTASRVLCGVNVPMIWRVLCYRTEPMERLVGRALDGGTHGVMPLAAPRPQNQSGKPLAHDQVHPHDQ